MPETITNALVLLLAAGIFASSLLLVHGAVSFLAKLMGAEEWKP